MADTKNPEEQAVNQPPVQEEAQSSSVGAEKVEETPQEQTAPSHEGAEIKSSKEGKSRLERRIEDLQGKLETAKTQEDKDRISRLIQQLSQKLEARREVPPEFFQEEPIFRPEDYGREIDPQELEERLKRREQSIVMKAIQAVESKRRYEAALQEHISDWENILKQDEVKNDPELRGFLEEQYKLANFTINPFTGQEDFVPVLKPSEVYARVKKILEKRAVQEGAKTLSELRRQSQESAVPPSSSAQPQSDYSKLSDTDIWRNASKIARELEEKLTK